MCGKRTNDLLNMLSQIGRTYHNFASLLDRQLDLDGPDLQIFVLLTRLDASAEDAVDSAGDDASAGAVDGRGGSEARL